jgi:hypothetical protein
MKSDRFSCFLQVDPILCEIDRVWPILHFLRLLTCKIIWFYESKLVFNNLDWKRRWRGRWVCFFDLVKKKWWLVGGGLQTSISDDVSNWWPWVCELKWKQVSRCWFWLIVCELEEMGFDFLIAMGEGCAGVFFLCCVGMGESMCVYFFFL